MSKIWIAGLLMASASAWAQPAIAPPSLGFVQDSARALRPVFGLAGNFILGPSVASKIVSAAFSGSIGLLKTDSSLAAFDSQGKFLASMDAPSGPALFAFSPSGTSALVYVATSNALLEWRGSAFALLAFHDEEVAGEAVLSIAFPTPFEAVLIVQRKNGIWELTFPLGVVGQVSQKALIGVQAPVLAIPSGDLVYHDVGGIVVRRTDTSEVRIAAALPANYSLQQMNRDWVQLTDLNSSARFAIHTVPGREAYYQLPESSQ
jgi:hypothetical protein